MNTRIVNFDGVNLIVPDDSAFDFPWPQFDGFPECCGPGPIDSLGNDIVPESIMELNISPACFIHDWTFTYWPKTFTSFLQANTLFIKNMLRINKVKGGSYIKRLLRIPPITLFYVAVSGFAGWENFKK